MIRGTTIVGSLVMAGLILTFRAGLAQEPPAAAALDQKLIAAVKVDTEVMSNLTHLSDVIGPRLTGSANLKRANDWAADTVRRYGLENVGLEAWELPVGWERGTATARFVEPNNGISLTVAAMGWTPGTKGRVTGPVILLEAKTSEELKKYEGKLKDAIILRGPPATVRPVTDLSSPMGGPPAATKTGDAPKAGDAPPAPPQRGGGGESQRMRRETAEFLRKEGAAVMMMDAAKPHGLMNMTGSWAGRDRVDAPEPLPALFVAHEHYALLHRLASKSTHTRLEVEITNRLVPGPVASHNNLGEIRGSEKPDEFVIVGAHIDSWDLGQGTTDNGTGTCVVLEAARVLAKCGVKPKRTIRFVLFSGEEQGLHGSKAYVARHDAEMPKVSAALVHDTGTGRIVGVSLMGRESLKSIVESELAIAKELGVTEINARPMGGSDHQSFEAKGVPGFMFRQDPAEYRLTHHSQSDTLDKAREPDLVQGAQVLSVLAMRLANRPEMLPREKRDAEKK